MFKKIYECYDLGTLHCTVLIVGFFWCGNVYDSNSIIIIIIIIILCGLVVRVLDYRSRGPEFDSRALQKKVMCLERGPLNLVSTTEKLLDRKVAAPV
jgi:hypothetical protein